MEGPVIVLVGTSHPGNAGAAARVAANFGASAIRFVAPRCDVKDKEAMDRAVHAKTLLTAGTIHPTLAEAVEDCALAIGTSARDSPAPHHFLRKPQDIRDWVESMKELDGKVAIVFGREDTGLTREEVNECDDLVTIPTADYNSLNLSHAVGILAYEFMRVQAATKSTTRTLEPGAVAALHKVWETLIDEVEDRDYRKEVAMGVFRKMVGRSRPDTYEVHNIMGIFTRTLKRFGHEHYATPKSNEYLDRAGLLVPKKDDATEE